MTNDGEHRGIRDEFLRNRRGAGAACFIVARKDLERASIHAAASIDLIDSEVDSTARHYAVSLFPGTGGSDDISVLTSAAASQQGKTESCCDGSH
jgi:hypothetical protein